METIQAPLQPLPLPSSKLVGRQREIADVIELLRNQRCVTLIGAAGSGKTRLALEAAARFASSQPNSPRLVELASLAEPALVPQAVAEVLGIKEESGRAIADTLGNRLVGYEGLLVLDNCEHLIEGCADLVDRLLRRCRGIRILATSREALRVDGEVAWVVPLLSTPAENASIRSVMRSEAVQLFVDRARQVSRSFEMTPSNASDVSSICRRLDGLPLAIELAASRVSVVDVKTISEQLSDRFRFLTGSFRTAPGRQRTLRAAIDWSHELLTPAERQLFARLSIFAGTFDGPSAEALCAGGQVKAGEVADLIGRLSAKSLLVGVESGDRARRYRQLDSIRAYGLERLTEAGELESLRRSHAERIADIGELYEKTDWPATMVLQLDNFREALGWSASVDRELQLRLAIGMGRYCIDHAYMSEGSRWLDGAIRSGVKVRPAIRAEAALVASLLAWRTGDADRANKRASEAVALYRRTGIEAKVATSLGNLGYVRILTGRFKEAESPLLMQMAISDSLGDPHLQEGAHYNLALLQVHTGDLESARLNLARSLALAQAGKRHAAIIHNLLGWVLLEMRDLEGARAAIGAAVDEHLERWSWMGLASDLDEAAEVAFLERAQERAMRLKGAADAIREGAGSSVPSLSAASRSRWVSRAERSLGKAARTAWLEGRRLSIGEAASYALASSAARAPRSAAGDGRSLSAREIEVSELVAQGMTNDQIASRLRIAKRTVDAHLEHIRGKLEVRSRVEVAAWLIGRAETARS